MELVNGQAAGAPTLKADVCRKHTLSCARKDEEKSLPEFRRGQKPRACESCYQSKVLCDKATPCSRCVSRGLTCRFRDVFDSGCSEQDAAYFKSESAGQAHTRVPVSNSVFLKGVVNPDTESMLEYFANDQAVNDKVPDLDYPPKLPDFSLPMMTTDGGNFAPWSFVSFLDDEFSDFSTSDETSTSSELSAAVPAFTLEGLERLRHISDEIIRELGKSHKFLEEYDPTYTEMYHEDLAHSIFSSDNLARFISVFFRLSHIHFPLIHIPSFGHEDTPAVLVLAVALGGTLRSAPRDDTLSSRYFLTVAEDYIFRHMQGLLVTEVFSKPSKKMLYALQAAIIVHNVQFMRNDAQTRRRNLSVRLPALVSAVRQLGLNQYKHSGTLIWEKFLYEELCIRIGLWTAISDWHQSGMFHAPPQTSIKEVDCDMPCPLELWDATSSEQFEAKLKELKYQPPPMCFSSICKFIELLMKDNWDEAQPIPVTSLKLSHLRAATMALSSMAVSAHLNGTMPATAPALLRAIDRWHDLWDAVTSKLDSSSLQRSGMARHSNDISALIRKVVEVAISDTEQPAFLKNVGHESLRELYDFILNH
ncbi:Fungal transcriptional regulatory protein, partial [Metarhizium majus ARSEF 297]